MKTNLKKLLALLLTLAMVLPMAVPMLTVSATESDATTTEVASTDDQQEYAYVGNFSESSEEVTGLPEGWVRHPNYKSGTVTQKNGAMYLNAKSVGGLQAAFYNQTEYSDYMVSADFTMVERANNTRYMGLTYRMGTDEAAMNLFYVKYDGSVGIGSYYTSTVTAYDGSTAKGWASYDQVHFKTAKLTGDNAASCKTTVNLKLIALGDTITAFVNNEKIFEVPLHNPTQEKGSFGIMATQCNIKVENFKVIDLTPNVYAYEDDFSESAEEITGLPKGWVRQKYFKNGTVTQMDGAMYLKAKSVSGLQAAYYEQSVYNDYLVSADFTMVDKVNTSRYMGLTYRMGNNEHANNFFMVKYNGSASFNAYYGAGIEAYDGTKTTAAGWQSAGAPYFKSITLSSVDSSLATAAQGTVNLKLAVVGGTMTGFVNNIKVLEVPIHNKSQALGSFGIMTQQADIKVENFKVIDLTELTQSKTADSIAHTLSLPTAGAADLYLPTSLGNYVASSTLSFDAAAEDTASAEIMIAKNGATELYATVQKNGAVTLTKATSAGAEILFEGTAEIADTTSFVVKTTYANGSAKLTVDGTDIGNAYLLDLVYGRYGFTTDGTASLVDLQLNKTVPHIISKTFNSSISEVEYNTTPDWSQIELSLKLSDGSVYQPEITADMITGFDPVTPGAQTLTLTYQLFGEIYTEKFTLAVKDDPENMPNIKVGVISDIHIGANSSNGPALVKALTYYKNQGVDVIVGVGDMGHDYTKYLDEFEEIYNTVFPDGEDGPEKFFVMGNHDTYCFEHDGYPRGTEAHNDAVEAYFTDTFDCVADYGRVGLNYAKIINGYVFVGLYLQTPIEEREAFLAEMFALPEAQGKPVFIVNHEWPQATLFAPVDGSGTPNELFNIIAPYSNAVLLTGHAHRPLADERCMWQDEFTALQSGSLFGSIVGANIYEGGRENGSFQDDNWSAKSGLYMEVRDTNINIVRYDFTHDEKLGKDWFIPLNEEGVADRTLYNYTLRAAAAVAPEFAADAQVTAEPLSESQIRITFPGSVTVYEEMDDIVQCYVIRAYDDDTNKLLAEKRVCAQYYLGRVPEKDTYTMVYTGLNSHTNYRFEVTAAESYQQEGQPLVVKADTKEFSTEGLTATFFANFDYAWDSDVFDFYNHNTENPITQTDGILQAMASNSSKAIVKDLTFANGTIETLISMNDSAANINGGIYLFASAAADDQDTITAYNVEVESIPDSKDLSVSLYKFSGKYDGNLQSVTLADYFEDGTAKAPVKLKIEVANGILTAYVDDDAVMTYTVGSMSGSVGLRSHYAGSDFDYIRVHETSAEYVAPDTENLEALFLDAKALLANTEVVGTDAYTGKNPYVTQETYDALEAVVNTYDVDLIRAYERHVVQVEAILTEGIAQFKAGILLPAVAQVGEQSYASVTEAIAAANGATVKVLMDTEEEITIHADVTIDLAGNSLSNVTVAEGASLTLVDSTADYSGTNGSATVTGTVERFTANGDDKYMVIGENGVYAPHKYYVGITHVSLDTNVTGFGYKAGFYGDAAVQAQIASIGYDLWLTEDRVVTRTLDKFQNVVTLRLKNFLVESYGEAPVNAKAVITLTDGTKLESAVNSYSMRSMIELLNDSAADFEVAQLQNVAMFIKKNPVMENWNVANILAVLQPVANAEAITVTDQSMTLVDGTTGTFTLNGAYQFTAQDTEQTVAYSDYADWTADYYITMDAEAADGLYLAGNYGDYGWIAIPVESGKTYTNVPVVQTLLGTSLTYEEMVTDVVSFSCGVADTQSLNTGATVTVELRLTNPENPEEILTLKTTTLTLA